MSLRTWAGLLLTFWPMAASAVEVAHQITDVQAMALTSGVNRISHFAPDGRDGIVILAWRDNGNAHGYDLALVMIEPRQGAGWNVVAIAPMDQEASRVEDVLRDTPHTGDDAVRSFRFARGKVDGEAATLLFIATRDVEAGASIPDPSFVTFEVYRLAQNDGDVGLTRDFFDPIRRTRSSIRFCHAEMALFQAFGLLLRQGYNGAQTPDGCP